MTDSNTQTTFANKIKILSELSENHRENLWLTDWFKAFKAGISFAHALHAGAVIDSESRHKALMEEPFDVLINHFGQEDLGFTSAEELLRTMAIDTWQDHD